MVLCGCMVALTHKPVEMPDWLVCKCVNAIRKLWTEGQTTNGLKKDETRGRERQSFILMVIDVMYNSFTNQKISHWAFNNID